jgi:hypothetical protein
MKTYRVSIDVKKLYTVSIEAKSKDEAYKLGNEMQSTEIAKKGTLGTVETEVMAVDEEN